MFWARHLGVPYSPLPRGTQPLLNLTTSGTMFQRVSKHVSQDETAGVWGQLVDAEVIADMDLEMLGEVHKKNVNEKLRIVERGNVVGQALGSSVLSPDNLPPVLGEEAGYGGAKAAEGDAATAEPDHQWDLVGRCGDVAVNLLVRNGRLQAHH